jgi:hypothetical protein
MKNTKIIDLPSPLALVFFLGYVGITAIKQH